LQISRCGAGSLNVSVHQVHLPFPASLLLSNYPQPASLQTMSDAGQDYYLPLQDQRVFGAGIKRKRVPFVRAESEPPSASQATAPKPSLGERYLSIVLPQTPEAAETLNDQPDDRQKDETLSGQVICAVCNLPITADTSTAPAKPHESSLAHQVCLSHSHPPSHLDREHIGFKYLSSYGWEPDSRRGLGASETGIRVPIKSKVKNDTVGLGVKDSDRVRVQKEVKEKTRLNAKQIRKQEAAGKKREKQLRDAFYGKDLEAYLGPGG
jgi:G-patch domain